MLLLSFFIAIFCHESEEKGRQTPLSHIRREYFCGLKKGQKRLLKDRDPEGPIFPLRKGSDVDGGVEAGGREEERGVIEYPIP